MNALLLLRLATLLSRFEPVHRARTEAERTSIFQMRYRVYVEEKRASFPGTDHARREIREPEDDLPDATLFYTGTPENITGSLRVRVWGPGEIPADVHRIYSLERFTDIETRTICTVGFLMVHPTLRGSATVVALTTAALAWTAGERGCEMMIAVCAPGLLDAYRRLGLRPYGAAPMSAPIGIVFCVAGIGADLDHARRCGSPWYPLLRRLAAEGKLSKRDRSALVAPFARGGIETDPAAVARMIDGLPAKHRSRFLDQLPPETRRRLASGGTVFDVGAGVEIILEDYASRDLFVILDGALDLFRSGALVATLGPGEVVGEIAFFRESGRHPAAVRTKTAAKLLHLRAGAIRRLAAKHPADATKIYEALASVLAERFATSGAGAPPPAP